MLAGGLCDTCKTRAHSVDVSTQVCTRVGLRLKHRRPGVSDWLVDLFKGWQPTYAPGRILVGWVKRTMRIDRSTKRYFEHVEDEAGTVIRHVEEDLTVHRGRGAPKR